MNSSELSTLVAFAQNFASANPVEGWPYLDEPPRTPVPDWLRDVSPNSVIPWNDAVPLSNIEGTLNPPSPADRNNPDALAYYLPFHFHPERWGIYIPISSIRYLAARIKGGSLVPGDDLLLRRSGLILCEHERLHATIELACTRAELLARRSIYREYFLSRLAALNEESLANAEALVRLKASSLGDDITQDKLANWMKGQGPGYRDFGRWMQSLRRGKERATRFMLEALPKPSPQRTTSVHAFLFRFANWRIYRNLPIFRINDDAGEGASALRPLPKEFGLQVLVHRSNDHPPPHVHIKVIQDSEFDTRYRWPELQPLEKNPSIPRKYRKRLDEYLLRHRDEIDLEMRKQVLS